MTCCNSNVIANYIYLNYYFNIIFHMRWPIRPIVYTQSLFGTIFTRFQLHRESLSGRFSK